MNIKGLFVAAALCAAVVLSGCGASKPAESGSRSSLQSQSGSSVTPAQSTADTSSSPEANPSSGAAPSPQTSFAPQKQLEGTDDYGELVKYIESHPNAVLVNISEFEDTTNPEVYDRIGTDISIIRIPYSEFEQRSSEIPSGRPVIVYGPVTQAIFAYGRLTEYRPDIPEVMYFFWIPIQMPSGAGSH